MCLPDSVLVYGDCAVNPNPTAEQLADIALASAETAQAFGIEPYVAMLSYSTGESGNGLGRGEGPRGHARWCRERDPDLPVEGPIQYDAAVDPEVAKTKLPDSRVAGAATVFIFPDLNSGNNTYKAVQRSRPRHRRRPGDAGAAQAGQRPEPRLHRPRHRQHRGHHRHPGPEELTTMAMKVLVINCGSSSIKFELFDMPEEAVDGQGPAASRSARTQAELSCQHRRHEQVD